jgi:hypothetical protein
MDGQVVERGEYCRGRKVEDIGRGWPLGPSHSDLHDSETGQVFTTARGRGEGSMNVLSDNGCFDERPLG